MPTANYHGSFGDITLDIAITNPTLADCITIAKIVVLLSKRDEAKHPEHEDSGF